VDILVAASVSGPPSLAGSPIPAAVIPRLTEAATGLALAHEDPDLGPVTDLSWWQLSFRDSCDPRPMVA